MNKKQRNQQRGEFSWKNYQTLFLVLTVVLFVVGCSTNKTESEEKEKTVKTTSIPTQYFDKKTTQSTISKSQMKKRYSTVFRQW